MKNFNRYSRMISLLYLPIVMSVLFLLLLLQGQGVFSDGESPQILKVDPEEASAGGVVFVEGTGFGSSPEENQVLVGEAEGKVLEVREVRKDPSGRPVFRLTVSIPKGAMGDDCGNSQITVSVPGRGRSEPRPMKLAPHVYVKIVQEGIHVGARTYALARMGGVTRPAKLEVSISPPSVATFESGKAVAEVVTSGGKPNEARLVVESHGPGRYRVSARFLDWTAPERHSETCDTSGSTPGKTTPQDKPATDTPEPSPHDTPGKTTPQETPTVRIPVPSTGTPTTIDDPPSLDAEWKPATAIRIERFGYYPDAGTMSSMMPGELIGLSVTARDEDVLLQTSSCMVGTDIRKHPPSPDKVIYEWKLEGMGERRKGRLIHPGGSESNSALYQIPFCYEAFPMRDKVIVTAMNQGHKANDEEAVVVFEIIIYANETPHSNGSFSYVQRRLAVDVRKKVEKQPADIPLEDQPGPCCVYYTPSWEKGSGLEVENTKISVRLAPDNYPDNMTVLHAEAHDSDDYIIRAIHRRTGEILEKKIPDVYDGCEFSWSPKKGTGSFPVGAGGPAVVFQHTYGKNNRVEVECAITDSGAQYADVKDPMREHMALLPRLRPLALVGVGDMSLLFGLWKEGHKEMRRAALLAVKDYEAAGYDVLYQERVVRSQIESFLMNPRAQAMMLLGHGSDDLISDSDEELVYSNIISTSTNSKWGCLPVNSALHPSLRQIILLACNAGNGDWGSRSFSLDSFYAFTQMIASPPGQYVWALSPIMRYVKTDFRPSPPRVCYP